ncbi:hypothetical protein POM88_020034 [Heracleum sosnowskyi]|uniref:Uncharacterized protein n=1 Tax=Heracleum sosnowskyi TaxID=360622 RepID=A0AAD8IAS7_9APIA|nr:hypothetical protein POM88_020034 [Heracleum sosnowskyi]
MVPHVFENLKTLDMSLSEDLITTPDFTKLPCLETLILKSFFQIYSEFGNPIQISSTEFPVWIRITQSSLYTGSMSLDLLVNVSCHFLGMILCFKSWDWSTYYSLKNTTSDFIWRDSVNCSNNKPLMVIVPRSIFSVKDGDDRIELTTEFGGTLAIHLLYKTEEHDNTTANED